MVSRVTMTWRRISHRGIRFSFGNLRQRLVDPFLGSGTTAVVAQKFSRRWCGVDLNTEYLCWALKRIAAAAKDSSIQGYVNGAFSERNSLPDQRIEIK